MPKREDLKTIMIIGSGPIIIGQACEFDYSGTQACKALRSLGYRIILVNSNPATIMTDPVVADVTYIEPLNAARLTEIIAKERPDALLPNLGGQTGLNLSLELQKLGVLEKYNVEIIGVQLQAIKRGEDRILFKEVTEMLGIEMAKSAEALTVDEAEKIAAELGYPVVIRPAYTMGGTGGGIVYNKEELRTVVARGIQASLIGQVLVEESILGWEELEVEVVRDSTDHMIAICMIENIDPMGVHTGDSFCSAPMLTISEEVQERLRKTAFAIVSEIGVIGGTNVQMAYDPKSDRIVVIEINPRTSRSSALASKATGFPIAYVSALLAAGLTLSEIPYWKEGTMDKYKPYGDYIVLKFARWAFEKFPGIEDKLGTQMRAVGEVMSIGRTFKEAYQKAIRSLEIGRMGLGGISAYEALSIKELLQKIAMPNSERFFIIYEALKKGATIDEIYEITKIKKYFLSQMKELADMEAEISACKGKALPDDLLTRAKKDGFADKYIAKLLGTSEEQVRQHREELGIMQEWDIVPVSGADAEYYYSTYNGIGILQGEVAASREKRGVKPVEKTNKQKVIILGGGPNRIGQGIEFDYCCVHTAFALRELGFETMMINCNPETVSTDYDTSDKLFFEPLTVEDVLAICKNEQPLGIIVQFGGQTPLNIAMELKKAGVPILGTTPETIALAEDRDLFRKMMDKMNVPMPESGMAGNYEQAVKIANQIGYPVMVRPSYVLGGRAMEVVYDNEQLKKYIETNAQYIRDDAPILIDCFLDNALECEADALADGVNAFVPAVMEHIEYAGVHSGDSACVIPTVNISEEQTETIREYTRKISAELGVVGLMNIQYAIHRGKVYVLEANPRASRTVPLVSKVCNLNMANIATQIIMAKATGGSAPALTAMKKPEVPYYGVKEAVFPFNMFPEVDPILGPEMRSTGEVLGLSRSFGLAFYKALEGSKSILPLKGSVLISVAEKDRGELLETARLLDSLGFNIVATGGTHTFLTEKGINSKLIKKIYEGRPNIADAIKNNELNMIINTPVGSKQSKFDDSYIRKSAIRYGVPYMTTLTAALAGAKGIAEKIKNPDEEIFSLQEYHLKGK